ncbi:MAG: hypothetical protein ABR584_02190 [Candidatus Baltobacteraceae bacterium]
MTPGGILLVFLVAVALIVAASIIPVAGRAIALKRRLQRLADSQLFIALSAAQTDASSLQKSIPELQREGAALQAAAFALRDAIAEAKSLPLVAQVRDVRAQFRALVDVLR